MHSPPRPLAVGDIGRWDGHGNVYRVVEVLSDTILLVSYATSPGHGAWHGLRRLLQPAIPTFGGVVWLTET